MSDYYYGCECERDKLFELSKYNYNNLLKDPEVVDIIKEYYKCEYLILNV